MPKQKPENKLSDKEQFKRFKEAAEKAGVDEKKAKKAFETLASRPSAQAKQN